MIVSSFFINSLSIKATGKPHSVQQIKSILKSSLGTCSNKSFLHTQVGFFLNTTVFSLFRLSEKIGGYLGLSCLRGLPYAPPFFLMRRSMKKAVKLINVIKSTRTNCKIKLAAERVSVLSYMPQYEKSGKTRCSYYGKHNQLKNHTSLLKPISNNINSAYNSRCTANEYQQLKYSHKLVFLRFFNRAGNFLKRQTHFFQCYVDNVQLFAYLLCHRLNIGGIGQKIKGYLSACLRERPLLRMISSTVSSYESGLSSKTLIGRTPYLTSSAAFWRYL